MWVSLGVIAVAIAAYMVGTFPSAHLVAYWVGHDPEYEGSGNPGASNVFRIAGKKAGSIVFAIDFLKGLLPVLAGLAIGGRPFGAVAWVAAVVGHIYPFYRGFRGGKGAATAGGGAFGMYPVLAFALLIGFVAIARIGGKASVASLAVAVGLGVGVVVLGRPGWELAVAAAVIVLVVVRHKSNIARLLAREEHSITSR